MYLMGHGYLINKESYAGVQTGNLLGQADTHMNMDQLNILSSWLRWRPHARTVNDPPESP